MRDFDADGHARMPTWESHRRNERSKPYFPQTMGRDDGEFRHDEFRDGFCDS
jgi:hypothetical protein